MVVLSFSLLGHRWAALLHGMSCSSMYANLRYYRPFRAPNISYEGIVAVVMSDGPSEQPRG
jgi:hypothetical protein